MRWLLIAPVWLYRRLVSPLKPRCCRFDPTCSAYAIEALRVHGVFCGSWLTLRRLLRCHPYGRPGFDPVPPRRRKRRPISPRAAQATGRSRPD